MSQRTASGCSEHSQAAPTWPPVSSSATNSSFSAPRLGRQPARARVAAPTASAATWFFMSSEPRPQRKPSATSADHGSCDQSDGSASTVSTWASRPSTGPSSSPVKVATRFGRLSSAASSWVSNPAARRYRSRCSIAGRSLPGGLTVSNRISSDSSPVASRWSSSNATSAEGYRGQPAAAGRWVRTTDRGRPPASTGTDRRGASASRCPRGWRWTTSRWRRGRADCASDSGAAHVNGGSRERASTA